MSNIHIISQGKELPTSGKAIHESAHSVDKIIKTAESSIMAQPTPAFVSLRGMETFTATAIYPTETETTATATATATATSTVSAPASTFTTMVPSNLPSKNLANGGMDSQTTGLAGAVAGVAVACVFAIIVGIFAIRSYRKSCRRLCETNTSLRALEDGLGRSSSSSSSPPHVSPGYHHQYHHHHHEKNKPSYQSSAPSYRPASPSYNNPIIESNAISQPAVRPASSLYNPKTGSAVSSTWNCPASPLYDPKTWSSVTSSYQHTRNNGSCAGGISETASDPAAGPKEEEEGGICIKKPLPVASIVTATANRSSEIDVWPEYEKVRGAVLINRCMLKDERRSPVLVDKPRARARANAVGHAEDDSRAGIRRSVRAMFGHDDDDDEPVIPEDPVPALPAVPVAAAVTAASSTTSDDGAANAATMGEKELREIFGPQVPACPSYSSSRASSSSVPAWYRDEQARDRATKLVAEIARDLSPVDWRYRVQPRDEYLTNFWPDALEPRVFRADSVTEDYEGSMVSGRDGLLHSPCPGRPGTPAGWTERMEEEEEERREAAAAGQGRPVSCGSVFSGGPGSSSGAGGSSAMSFAAVDSTASELLLVPVRRK